MSRKDRVFSKDPLRFLAPSGVQHAGRTFESYYADMQPEIDPAPTYTPPTESAPVRGKGATAQYKRPRHQHDWLHRHDYMQCRTCGLLITPKDKAR